jgi:hypothetical protein
MSEAQAIEMIAEGSPASPEDEVAALKARLAELEPKPTVDYVWPQPTEEQNDRNKVGGEAVTRVVKVTYSDPKKRFWSNGGVKTVHIAQWRVPMANQKFDIERLYSELRHNGLMLLEEAFSEAGHYCETNNCWNKTRPNESYCSPKHRMLTETAHERVWQFE